MGFRQESAALAVDLPPTPKHVLQVLAFRACESCGRAWPGVARLATDTGLTERTVSAALAELRKHPDVLVVYAYPDGGRGVATEYVVMPKLARLSPSDCGECSTRLERVRQLQGIGERKRQKGESDGTKRVKLTGDQPSDKHEPSTRASARGGAASPQRPISTPTPPPPAPDLFAENARQAAAMVERLSERMSEPDRAPETKHGSRRGP